MEQGPPSTVPPPGPSSPPDPFALPAPRSPADTHGGPVPPGGWHQPAPAAPVPGRLAGWWSRACAAVIDGLVVSFPAVLLVAGILALLAGPAGAISIDDGETGVLVGILAVILSVLLLMAAVFLTALVYAPVTMRRPGARNGQTWGKQVLGIRVIRTNGEPQTLASAAVREVVVKFLLFGLAGGTLASIPTLLDLLWPLWDGENRALHDMVVDTRVIRA